jgi:hypothetical protein
MSEGAGVETLGALAEFVWLDGERKPRPFNLAVESPKLLAQGTAESPKLLPQHPNYSSPAFNSTTVFAEDARPGPTN